MSETPPHKKFFIQNRPEWHIVKIAQKVLSIYRTKQVYCLLYFTINQLKFQQSKSNPILNSICLFNLYGIQLFINYFYH